METVSTDARRYFWDARASDPVRVLPALGFIQQLYAVERESKGRDGSVRLALRIEQALPVLGRFRRWLDEQADVVLRERMGAGAT
jgi:transposase